MRKERERERGGGKGRGNEREKRKTKYFCTTAMDTRQRNNVQNDQKEKQMHELDFVKRISQWKKARHDIDSTTNMPVSTINCIQGERKREREQQCSNHFIKLFV